MSYEAMQGKDVRRKIPPVCQQVKGAIDADISIKLIILCSPGNANGIHTPLPSACAFLNLRDKGFSNVVIVNQAYIDLSGPNTGVFSPARYCMNICIMNIRQELSGWLLYVYKYLSRQNGILVYFCGHLWYLHITLGMEEGKEAIVQHLDKALRVL
ncbi:hypothetical protein BDQ12DRAFT_670760 [Crucibulum laeve]|uniref:Uncharacterized protein n=1 Tax=Crucibulum laeve TaxID=68775 RepID=A0A5C3LIB5_9AGAR|nr:hypothetical protein BDQ12DRAFT_670760 [Crucibulum laeve]